MIKLCLGSFLLLLVLDASGLLALPWWVVTSPLWIIPAVLLACFGISSIMIIVDDVLSKRKHRKTREAIAKQQGSK